MDIEKILEATGIDLLPYAIGLSKFKSYPPFEPVKLTEIREKVQSLDTKELDDALEYSKELLDEESSRGEKTEGKAYNLIGVTGISAAFITGISSFLPSEKTTLTFPVILLLFFYLFVVLSLTLTVLLASRVVMVRNYTYPDIADIFKMGSLSLVETKKDRLATYMYCYAKNCQTHNIKVSYLIGAQLWFRNSIIAFLALAIILISNFVGVINDVQAPISGTPSLTATYTQTQSPISVTQAATVTTKPSQTLTPINNIVLSTDTPTP